ncbi:Uncharacterised protein [Escherichia coli]|nr:hypothetical protein [Escherichia coli]STD40659.1 Uncharacterised protein [Escherichia coli]
MNMKKTLLVILTGITLASPVAGAATCRRGPLPKPAAEPPGAGAHSQPGMVTAGE